MKKALLLAAAFLSACFALSANDQGAFSTKDILLICSHAESSDWAQDMLRPVYELENQRSDIQVFPVRKTWKGERTRFFPHSRIKRPRLR